MKSPARLAFRDGASHKGKEKRNDMTLRKRQGNPTYRICQPHRRILPIHFSNRPFGVKHFQTSHHRHSVDVARGLVLLL